MREQGFWTHKDYNPLPKKEREILSIKASQGDQDAKDQLIKSCMRLAVKRSMKWARLNPDVPIDDLIQEACVGLVEASNKINPERGAFTTCAVLYIDKNIMDFCIRNSLIYLPRNVRWHYKNKVNTEETKQLAKIAMKKPLSWDFYDLAYEEDADIDLDKESRLQEIKSVMGCITDRERNVIKEKYFSNIIYESNVPIAEKLHSSRQNIAQAECRALEKIRQAIRNPCIANKSPRCSKKIEIGQPFHKWTVISKSDRTDSRGNKIYHTCKCECGTIKDVVNSKLIGRLSRSCGCDRAESRLAARNAKNLSARS